MYSTTLILGLIIFVGLPIATLLFLIALADNAPEMPKWMQEADDELRREGR